MNDSRRSRLRIFAVVVACIGFYLYLASNTGTSFETFLLFQFAAGYLYYYAGRRSATARARREAFSQNRRNATARTTRTAPRAGKTTKNEKREIAKHTHTAVRNAGRNPEDSPVRLLDIGLLVYFEQSSEPSVYRIRDIPEQAEAIRPFAIFHLSEKAYGPIRFEIYDHTMRLLFRDEEEHQFEIGKNYRTTRYYFRLRDELEFHDRWCLQLFSGDHAIAFHYFEWYTHLDIKIAADGEVSAEDRESFMESEVLEEISLDQLISSIN